jgi:hypothetical protein
MNEPGASSIVDKLSKAASLMALVIGIVAAYKALPLDYNIKKLQGDTANLQLETTRLDNSLKQTDSQLKQTDSQMKMMESSRKLTFDLYGEVVKVLERKDKDDHRREDVVRVLVETLADDPFRWKLLAVIRVAAKDPEVRRKAGQTSEFYRDELLVKGGEGTAAPEVGKVNVARMNVDMFYCEESRSRNEPLAKKALDLKNPALTGDGRWRSRLLPDELNARPGYNVHKKEIRLNSDEREVARRLQAAIRDKMNIEFELLEISYPTPGYIQ